MKSDWRSRVKTQLIFAMIIIFLCILAYRGGDKQVEHWKDEGIYELYQFVKDYSKDGYVSAPEVILHSESEKVSNSDIEKAPLQKVLSKSKVSPDDNYIAETYGRNEKITAGGINPSEEIRIREASTDQILWSIPGAYECDFLWSPDSRNLAIVYRTRIEGITIIVDTVDFSERIVPLPAEILTNMKEDRPDSYVTAFEWTDNSNIQVGFQYIGKDELSYTGDYIYDPTTGEIKELNISEGLEVG